MAKVYLSPAAHGADNPTKCPDKCGENVHANLYMDIVERRLKECGVEVKRGDRSLTGSKAMTTRVKEANKWKADIYYVAHTNAGGGRYAVTYCYNDAKSKDVAKTFGKYKKSVENQNGYKWRCKGTEDLYEINAASMMVLYDEVFFHDNRPDCEWFHNGGMELCAEETVQGLCAVLGVPYKTTPKEVVEIPDGVEMPPATPITKWTAGEPVWMVETPIYTSATAVKAAGRKNGTYYVYDGEVINGRIRITNSEKKAGKKPVWLNVTGWMAV